MRTTGEGRALYAARVGRVTGARQVLLDGGALGSIVCTVDLGSGASEPVHLGG
ncbi:MAG: hypothetical protein ACT4PV_11905 [Planctomycetaceae bacterium]